MRRRDFVTMFGGAAAAWSLTARAQQAEPTRRVGVLMSTSSTDPYQRSNFEAFVRTLRNLGWSVGRNVVIDDRWGAGEVDRMRRYARELVGRQPDVILVQGAATPAMQQATNTIPVVFVLGSDPVAQGTVASLAHPGGNITGFPHLGEASMGGKWLELLTEIAPRVHRVAFVFNPQTAPQRAIFLHSIEASAPSLSVEVISAPVREAAEIEGVIASFAREEGSGLLISADAFMVEHRQEMVNAAARYRLPAVYPFSIFCRSGGLICYGVDIPDLFARAASYVDRILKGAKTADLPVQLPTKFELVINLKTAKEFGLDVPLPPTAARRRGNRMRSPSGPYAKSGNVCFGGHALKLVRNRRQYDGRERC